jgi:hypothetical protein
MLFMKVELRLITGGSYNCRQTLLVSVLEFENHAKKGHGKQKCGPSRKDEGRGEKRLCGRCFAA